MIEPNWEEQMWQSMFSTRQAEQNAKALQPELQRLGLNADQAGNVANLIAKYIENGALNPTEVNYLNRNADVREAFNAIVGENDITGFQWEADTGTTDGGLQQQFGQDATGFDNAQAVITDPATGEVMDSGLDGQDSLNIPEMQNPDGTSTLQENSVENSLQDDIMKKEHMQKLLQQSTCRSEELIRYLEAMKEPEAAEHYRLTGEWIAKVQIPKNSSVLRENGKINWEKAPQNGYALDKFGKAIRRIYQLKIGEIIDRYGPESGRFTSPVIDGKAFSYDERSLPYVEDASQYSQYRVIGDFSKIEEYVKRCSDTDLVKEINKHIKKWYRGDYNNVVVYAGEIAKVDGWGTGGGIQYELPLSIECLVKLGLLKKIK